LPINTQKQQCQLCCTQHEQQPAAPHTQNDTKKANTPPSWVIFGHIYVWLACVLGKCIGAHFGLVLAPALGSSVKLFTHAWFVAGGLGFRVLPVSSLLGLWGAVSRLAIVLGCGSLGSFEVAAARMNDKLAVHMTRQMRKNTHIKTSKPQ